MALIGSGQAYIGAGAANTGWQFDSVNADLVPLNAAQSNYGDLNRSIGRQASGSLPIGRALVNQVLPVGVYMVQTA